VNTNTRIGEVEIGIAKFVGMDIAAGTSAEVKFITDEVKGGIVIARNTIKKLKDQEFVYVVENHVAQEQPIKTGLVEGDKVEIIEGLMGREKIAVNNLNRIYDGAKVYIAKGEDI
jgi:transcription antitermination factor NusG